MNIPEYVWNARTLLGEGPLWSMQEPALYWVDIIGHRLHRYSPSEGQRTWQFEKEVSAIAERAEVDKEDGSPDGMATDAEGGLWIAHWGASKLTRHDSQGNVLCIIGLPCRQVTGCTFGGPDFRMLYVTTAANGLSPKQLEREPLAGGLFALKIDIAGVPANPFRG